MSEWQPIETAPKDGRKIKTRRVVDGKVLFQKYAVWRTVTFGAFINGPHGVEPSYTATGWMCPDIDKRVPEPTHWLP